MAEPKVIYEDKNFIAVNKPAGLLVHPARINADVHADKRRYNIRENLRTNQRESATLVDWLLKRYPEIKNVGDDPANRPGIVHRLDKDTSGIMLIPRNQKYFEYLKSLFAERKIWKTYLAVVYGRFSEKRGLINKPIGIKNGTTKRSVFSEKMAKEAVTEYRVLKNFRTARTGPKPSAQNSQPEDFSLLEVKPKTGRTHQIRVHLASIGHPVVGDKLYGRKIHPAGTSRLMLHALSLEFSAAAGKRIKLETPPPPEFADFILT